VADSVAGGTPFRGAVPDLRTRSVDEARCPLCSNFVLEHYAVVEMSGAPYQIERVLGRSCTSPDCAWWQEGS
jgi:hypothetical protein